MTDVEPGTGTTRTERVVETVSSWLGVTLGEGRFGATTFRLGDVEVGHVHPNGAVDISYAPSIRDRLIEEGRANPHRIAPNSPTGTSFQLAGDGEIDHAVWLLRLSYLFHVAVQRHRDGTDPTDPEVDVDGELDTLGPSAELARTFADAVRENS